MSETSAVDVVADVIQRVYEDGTQTELDRRAASEIVKALRSHGWASLDEVAMLIQAAGGTILVPDRLVVGQGERVVERHEDFAERGTRFTVRTR